LQLLQIGVTEWDGQDVLRRTAGPGFAAAFLGRPDWLYSTVVVSIAVFIGQVTIYALRRAGVATLLALLVLSFRLASLAVLQAWRPEIGMGFLSHLLLVPPLVALDLWYATHRRQAEKPATIVGGSLLAGAVSLAAAVPAIASVMPSPRIGADTLPAIVAMGLLMALAGGYAGARLGSWLGTWQPAREIQSPDNG